MIAFDSNARKKTLLRFSFLGDHPFTAKAEKKKRKIRVLKCILFIL